jgi:uncharacterized protein
MKLRRTFALFLVVLTVVFVVSGQSLNTSPLPEPTGMVNDYAEIIDDTVQTQIEQKLRDFKARTNPQVEIAVVTVRTTGDRPIQEYSLAVARGWKIGTKDDDNPSALLFIAVDDKKYFTQVSKDLEDELTDGIVGSLQRQYLVPAFRQGNYTKGISETTDAFIRTIEERKSDPNATPTPRGSVRTGIGNNRNLICCCIALAIIAFIIISNIGKRGGGGRGGSSRRDRDRWGGGSFIPIIIPWGGGSSSGSDWGSGSSGGDSWGGFGGGGDFGGGGAGGDW